MKKICSSMIYPKIFVDIEGADSNESIPMEHGLVTGTRNKMKSNFASNLTVAMEHGSFESTSTKHSRISTTRVNEPPIESGTNKNYVVSAFGDGGFHGRPKGVNRGERFSQLETRSTTDEMHTMILELEHERYGLYILSIRNQILLDSLAMNADVLIK
jgi:hypothetical protein